MIIDLHTHTLRYSRCSRLSPQRLCYLAIERGLNALAITEHGTQWRRNELAELQAMFCSSLQVYAGVEISCTDGRDYVVLGLEAEEVDQLPVPTTWSALDALLRARPQAFVFVAHCFRFSTDEGDLEHRRLDGIEIGSYNTLCHVPSSSGQIEIARLNLYEKWRANMDWVALYNSDAHTEEMVGVFGNQIEAAEIPPDETALADLLRRALVQKFQNDDLIRRAL